MVASVAFSCGHLIAVGGVRGNDTELVVAKFGRESRTLVDFGWTLHRVC